MKLLQIVVLILASALAVADNETSAVDMNPSESFDTAQSRALDAIAQATDIGNIWTTSGQLLDAALAAHESGDDAEAIRLADEARIHAELAMQQAEVEAASWRDNVIGVN